MPFLTPKQVRAKYPAWLLMTDAELESAVLELGRCGLVASEAMEYLANGKPKVARPGTVVVVTPTIAPQLPPPKGITQSLESATGSVGKTGTFRMAKQSGKSTGHPQRAKGFGIAPRNAIKRGKLEGIDFAFGPRPAADTPRGKATAASVKPKPVVQTRHILTVDTLTGKGHVYAPIVAPSV